MVYTPLDICAHATPCWRQGVCCSCMTNLPAAQENKAGGVEGETCSWDFHDSQVDHLPSCGTCHACHFYLLLQ